MGVVVLSHAHLPGFAGGFVGVDVFFVISGFLITGLLLGDAADGRVSFAKFYSRRALRILPAATLVIVATGIASLLILNPLRAKGVLVDSVWASLFAANVKFGRDGTDYFSEAATSPLQHFWSLAVEEQFYLVWPALLALTVFGLTVLPTRLGVTPPPSGPATVPRGCIAVVLAAVGTVSLLASLRETVAEPTAAYFSTIARAWELVAGALLATGLPLLGRLPERVRSALTWGGIAGIAVAAVTYDAATPFPGSAALLPVLATCAVVAGGIGAPRWGANRVLGRRPLRFTGDISYSLYLWHWPLLILAAGYVGHDLSDGRPCWWWAWPCCCRWPPTTGWRTRCGAPGAGGAASPMARCCSGRCRWVPWCSWPWWANPPRRTCVPPCRPPIDQILQDRTIIGDCSGYRRTESQICQYGDPQGSKKLVLFGNSHALAWLPGVEQVAKGAGWRLFPVVKEACDYPGYLAADPDNQCSVWYDWAKQQIADLHPDLIIMNGYDAGASDWEPALTQAVTDLKPLGTRELMLTDVPGTGEPFDCLQQRDATLQTCLFPDPESC